MRIALLGLVAAIIAAACGGSSSSSTPTPTTRGSTTMAATSAASPRSASSPTGAATGTAGTPPPTRVAPGDAVELTGVVGSITAATRTIQVTRLSGANVNQVQVQDSTRIRKAEGGSETFAQIRTSDRIIASGRVDDRGDALIADEITVQSGVPGAQPGG